MCRTRYAGLIGVLAAVCLGVVSCAVQIASQQVRPELMYVGFGGQRSVSGSMHALYVGEDVYLVDVGVFLGGDGENEPWPVEAAVANIKAVFITHAHADHVGRLPLLLHEGYRGPLFMTLVTRELTALSLAGNVALADLGVETFYYSRNNRSERKPVYLDGYDFAEYTVNPDNRIYFEARRPDLNAMGFYLAPALVRQLRDELATLIDDLTVVLNPGVEQTVGPFVIRAELTSHMPGASMFLLRYGDALLVFSGDVGSDGSPLLPPTKIVNDAIDVLVMEGTYGTDRSIDYADARGEFRRELGHYVSAGYRVIVPAFVLDRTQQVLHELHLGMEAGTIPRTTVFVCSQQSRDITDQYHWYAERLDAYSSFFTPEMAQFNAPGLGGSGSCRDDQGNLTVGRGEIAVMSSGMADFAYARQAVDVFVDDPATLFYFVGYQSPSSPGGILTDGATSWRVGDDVRPVLATILRTVGFSGHGTPNDMERLFGAGQPKRLLLVHVDEDRVDSLLERYGGGLTHAAEAPALRVPLLLVPATR